MRRSPVITGENQDQAGGLAGPFCVPSCSQVLGNLPVYSVSHVPEAVLSSRFSVLRLNRQHSAITQKNHAADERGFTQILANVDQLIRGGIQVTSRSGAPEMRRSRVITGESQGQARGLAGPFLRALRAKIDVRADPAGQQVERSTPIQDTACGSPRGAF